MPVFQFDANNINFPPAHFADSDGLLGEGGAITADWLLEGYRNGFFMWTNPMRYPKWWTPDPRIVMFPKDLKVSGHVEEGIEKANFTVKYNDNLEAVMKLIQGVENKEEMNSGWLTGKFMKAFLEIEERKLALSISVFKGDELVGGAFGASNGKVFFCEYINGTVELAKEHALIEITKKLHKEDFYLIDLHKETTETIDVGLQEISRSEYIQILKK